MGCSLCSIFACIYQYVMDKLACAMESPIMLILIALFITFVILCNVHSASRLCNSQAQCGGLFSSSGSGSKDSSFTCYSSALGKGQSFDYGPEHGPHTWPCAQNNQSPINIVKACVVKHTIMDPLSFCNFGKMPKAVLLENNGHTLIMRASYDCEVPEVAGADLLSCYRFVELCFRWSWYDSEGSEHAIDYQHFPLELQALHRAGDAGCGDASSLELLMVSYFYELSAENPYLDAILQYLVMIQTPGNRIEVPPFPLSYLMPPFQSNFYSYSGSLTEPPCHRGTEWILNPEALAIGPRQLNEFRQLRCFNGARIRHNARPVQPLGVGREINFSVYDCVNDSSCLDTSSSNRSSSLSSDFKRERCAAGAGANSSGIAKGSGRGRTALFGAALR